MYRARSLAYQILVSASRSQPSGHVLFDDSTDYWSFDDPDGVHQRAGYGRGAAAALFAELIEARNSPPLRRRRAEGERSTGHARRERPT